MKKTTIATRVVAGLTATFMAATGALAGQELQQPAPFEGPLLGVDSTTQTILVGDEESEPMTFVYSEDTEVVGSVEDVQGLNGRTGAPLRVHYEIRGESAVATRIEVLGLENQDR